MELDKTSKAPDESFPYVVQLYHHDLERVESTESDTMLGGAKRLSGIESMYSRTHVFALYVVNLMLFILVSTLFFRSKAVCRDPSIGDVYCESQRPSKTSTTNLHWK